MVDQAGLTSPTLARLYLQQGHVERARKMLDALLESQPHNGAALALHRRLGISEGARFKAKLRPDPDAQSDAKGLRSMPSRGEGGTLEFRWTVYDPDLSGARLEIWLRLCTQSANGAQSTSSMRIACDEVRGHARAALPHGPGAGSACLVAIFPQDPSATRRAQNSSDDRGAEQSSSATAGRDDDDDNIDIDREDPRESERILAVADAFSW